MPDYLTTDEAAAILGYHVKYVRKIAAQGKLKADKKAGVWLIHRQAVHQYVRDVEGKNKHDPTRGR